MPKESLTLLDKSKSPRKKYLTGLSLLEILVATVILVLVMTGLANIFVAGKRHILHSRSRMAGGKLGKYFLDPLQMQVRQDQWGSNCLSAVTGCDTAAQTIDNITYTPTYSISDVSGTTLRRVKVTLTWNETTP